MSLNFPSNRDQLDPPQPSGPLQDGDAYENAGILWTWSDTLKVWSSAATAGGGGASVSVGPNPPADAEQGDLWWNNSDDSGRLYVYYDDGDSKQWVEASPQGDAVTEGDTDGLYLSKVSDDTAAGQITFNAGLISNGNVGVGTTDPQTKLQVKAGSNAVDNYSLTLTNSADNYGMQFGAYGASNKTFGATNIDYKIEIGGDLILDPTGNVGIGTDNPQARLDVDGLIQSSGGITLTGFTSSNGPDDTVYPLIHSGEVAGGRSIKLNPRSADSVESVYLIVYPPQTSGKGGGVHISHDKTLDEGQANNLRIAGKWSGDYTVGGGSTNAFNSYLLVTAETQGSTTSTGSPISGVGVGLRPDANTHFIGVRSRGKASSSPAAAEWIGVKSEIASDHATTAFNFYASGTASNYFAGKIILGGGALNTQGSLNYATSLFAVSNGSGDEAPIELRGHNNSAKRTVQVFTSTTGAGAGQTPIVAGKIVIQAGGTGVNYVETSDYRLKSDILELSSTTEIIKALKPCTYKMHGVNKRGFLAHELQEVCPEAVSGVKDETEAIGTLADYNGTVLETEVTEPSAEELEYTEEVETDGVATMVTRTRSWTATGTRPVYQGVDQSKLIPLLTKALQEVIAENEDIKARLTALEGA